MSNFCHFHKVLRFLWSRSHHGKIENDNFITLIHTESNKSKMLCNSAVADTVLDAVILDKGILKGLYVLSVK